MEIGLEPGMPTYSGGLGVLAGDTVRAAADLRIPLVAVALLHRKGYFYQRLDASGWQREEPAVWSVDDFAEEMPPRVTVTIEGRVVHLRCWRREVVGQSGFRVPVYLLDADLTENSEWDRALTHVLYGGDSHYRICQEVILGIGGLRMLRALGYEAVERFHMNEGHAAFLALELLENRLAEAGRTHCTDEDLDAVRKRCVFTTHTPVPAGHDRFPMDLVYGVLGRRELFEHGDLFRSDGGLNMTYLALNLSRFSNAVARRHAEVAGKMFPRHTVDAITNGIHTATWIPRAMHALFDRYLPGWRADYTCLRNAELIDREELWQAHRHAKERLLHYVNRADNVGMDVDTFTIGFARRAAAYKRHGLLFHDLEWLRKIAKSVGPLQIVYAGKAHPHDRPGKEMIQQVYRAKETLRDVIKIAYIENYDMELGRLMTAGVDLWLNTPQPPLEASGTSGMKAAVNGVPSLSILDGWWVEGCVEGVTGWAIGEDTHGSSEPGDHAADAASLYRKLEHTILPMYYHDRESFLEIMVHCISINGAYFNTHRMMQEYVLKAYFR